MVEESRHVRRTMCYCQNMGNIFQENLSLAASFQIIGSDTNVSWGIAIDVEVAASSHTTRCGFN